ncbi:protein NRT1/ PTR FAMILY 4.5 [Amborella trichopoda]|uniref:protein NRT1/ PTR FAMILY 4.5 n=1 Tax=Amborella trichopoda TaxID=13333 RepID=UPI0009BEBA0E|nr:protein NRT1/ PTR FAMILY 4.5 [Amborella trichopoda]|eukprot:XP_020520617.1 protein NRT1/ PTR FAMILY 4.5 [Amborella trichopoda]
MEGRYEDVETPSKAKAKSKSKSISFRRGGMRATSFIFVMAGLENMGFVANMVSLVLYFMMVMYFDLAGSSTTLTNLMGTTFLVSLLGGYISDTYLARLNTTLIFGFIEVVGYILLTTQAHYKALQPDFCLTGDCLHGRKAAIFYSSLYLIALGAGGIRGSLPALGADQFSHKEPKEKKHLAGFFNWLLMSITIGASIGVTVIVWLDMNKGWDLGFFVSMIATVVGLIVLTFGVPFYRGRVPGDSPLQKVLQVIVVAFKNMNKTLPENPEELYEISNREAALDEERLRHTKQFRFLNKAAIVQGEEDVGPWKVCTVTQVEEVKILTRMLPLIGSTIIMNTCLAQLQTFSIHQGIQMDPYLGKFKVPAASIPVIPLFFMSILIPIYELIFVPVMRKITGHPSGITHLQRVGVGLVLSVVSMVVAGLVEVKRRNAAIHDGKDISLFWLSFHYAIFGIADMFTLVGLMEFFYSEAPASMRSLSTSFSWLSLSIGYFLSTIFVDTINSVTQRITPSKLGWLHGTDMNLNNLDLFYWFLAILSALNFVVYLFCAKWYKYKKVSGGEGESGERLKEIEKISESGEGLKPIEKTGESADGESGEGLKQI